MSSRLLSITVMVSLVALLLVPALPAAHTAAAALIPNATKGGINIFFLLNVSNNGPASLRRVSIAPPTGFNLTNGSFIMPAGWTATCAPDAFCSTGKFSIVNFSASIPDDQIASGTTKQFIFHARTVVPVQTLTIYDDFSEATLDATKWRESFDVQFTQEHGLNTSEQAYHAAQITPSGGIGTTTFLNVTRQFQANDRLLFDMDYRSGNGNRIFYFYLTSSLGSIQTPQSLFGCSNCGAVGFWNGAGSAGNDFGVYRFDILFFGGGIYWNVTRPDGSLFIANFSNHSSLAAPYNFTFLYATGDNGVVHFDTDNVRVSVDVENSTPDGTFVWPVSTLDNAGDSTLRDVTVTVDSTPPFVALLAPTPASGTVLAANLVQVNFTATDANMDRLTLTFDGVNETITGNTTKTGLADGVHTFQFFVVDLAGNSNSTEQRTVTIDTTQPQFTDKTDVPSTPATFVNNQKYQFNITVVDATTNTVTFEINGTTNITSRQLQMVQNGSLFTVELRNLTPTVTRIRWYANDSFGRTNFTEQTYIVNPDTPVMVSALTQSSSVTVTFSKALDQTTLRAEDFTLNGSAVAGAALIASGNVTLTLNSLLPTDATPNITYTKGTLRDTEGVTVENQNVIANDGIPPRVVAARTGNINGSSSDKNKVQIQFSEDINGATVGMSDFSIAGNTITAADETSPGLVTLTLSSNLSSLPSNETPAVVLTGNGIRDLAGNTNASAAFIAADGISPEIFLARLPTTSIIFIIFTEEMDPSTFAPNDFVVVNLSRTITNISFSPAFITQGVNLTMNEPVPTDTMPVIFIAGAVADRVGNTLATGQVTGDDKMAPVFQSARTVNTTAIEVTFSEPMDRGTVTVNDFYITNPNNSVRAIHSATVNASTFTLIVETPFGVDDTPTITTNDTVSDSRGNPQIESISITATDGILPAAENITLTFFQGLNFFSVPKRLQNASSQSALSGLNFTTFLRFDPVNGWVIPTTIEPLEGYWINVSTTQTISLTFAGASVTPPPQKSIFAGWSTVGSPNTGSLDAGMAYVSIDRAYTNIAGFNNAAKTFSSAINDPNKLENLSFFAEQGRGYWVFAIQNATLASLSP